MGTYSEQAASIKPLQDKVETTLAEIRSLVPELVAADHADIMRARREISRKHWCLSKRKERQFVRIATEMLRQLEELHGQFQAYFRRVWVSSHALSAPTTFAQGIGAWEKASEDAQQVLDRINELYRRSDRWQGRGGSSYSDRLPAQSVAAADMVTSLNAQASGLTAAAQTHYAVNSSVCASLQSARLDLRAAMGFVGGGGVYMRRTAQAIVVFKDVLAWLEQAAESTIANAGELGQQLRSYEDRLRDHPSISQGAAPVVAPVATGTQVTVNAARVTKEWDGPSQQVDGIHV